MTSPAPSFVPKPSPDSTATRFGHHYVSDWVACRRKWFYRYVFPTASGQLIGIVHPYTNPAPMLGQTVHEGLAAWYLSGWRSGADTGEYDLGRALLAAEAAATKSQPSYQDPERWTQDWAQARELLTQYHETFGPQGLAPDWPRIKVIGDASGAPLVERAWEVPIITSEGGRYVYTCRTDLIVEDVGYLQVMEHKTSVASWVARRTASAQMDSQFTGELAALHHHFPDLPCWGVKLNVLVKGRSKTSGKFNAAERETITRTPEDVASYLDEAAGLLGEIDRATACFADRLKAGDPWQVAAQRAGFWETGRRTDHCHSFNSRCAYYDLCRMKGHEDNFLPDFRPRVPEPVGVAEDAEL